MAGTWDVHQIVVGIDGSPSSDHAAQMAVSIARSAGAALTFVTVVRPPEGWWGIVGAPPTAGAVTEAVNDAQRSVLDEALGKLDLAGVSHESLSTMGDPAHELLAICADRDADLLVVGRRGAGIVERVMMGSVATRVAVHTDVPVLIVP